MSDLEFLYVLLVAFYLWECTAWIRGGAVMFVRGWRRHAVMAPILGNQYGGFALAHPLPPLGAMTVAAQFPLSLSKEGVLAYVAGTVNAAARPLQTCRFVRWTELKSIEAKGRSVRVNGELLTLAQSTIHARWLAGELRTLLKLPEAQREEGIARLIQSTFDAEAFAKRWAEFESRASVLRLLANAALLFVFVAAPVVITRYGIVANWPMLVIGLFALTGTAAVFFYRAHRTLHPNAGDERFAQTLMVLLFSPAAMRAADMLSRPLAEPFHPLVAARVLCREATFKALAQRLLLDLRHPRRPLAVEGKAELAAIEENSRQQLLRAAEALVREAGVDLAELTRPPARLDATCRAFCPRCHAQFTATDLRCTDCGGLPIQAFES